MHVVLVSLSDPADGASLVRQARERLGGIPSVAGLQVGPPIDIGRTGIDLSYDVAIVVSFDDVDGYRAYLEHPEHLGLVADWKPRATAMRIHDVVAGPLPERDAPRGAADADAAAATHAGAPSPPGTDAAR